MTVVLRVFLGGSAVLLALLGLSVPFVEPGSGAYVVSLLSLVMLATVFLGSAALLYAGWDPFEEIFGRSGS